MNALIQEILNDPLSTLLIIGNLILIESLLSVDNAAVLATMVMELPKHKQRKALKYGIVGAYIFRGICLLLASFLTKIWWLKGIGGIYLIYLFANWLRKKSHLRKGEHVVNKKDSWFYRNTSGRIGEFWATVIAVEVMDLAFSLDNVFAAVAFSKNILIILCGVFIGILAMRFVAQGFVQLMNRYPFLETCAYLVICILGIKLTLTLYTHNYPESGLTKLTESEHADWVTSGLTLCVFFLPILTSALFGIPRRNK